MVSTKGIIAGCERLYEDLELAHVGEYKTRRGCRAIGFLPIYVPREVIHAAGMLPVGLMGAGSDLEIIKGDAYFQSYICHIPRSTIELAVAGRLACLDGFLFPAICDVIRNLSGMWKILFPDKYVRYVDLPQDFSEIGGEFYRGELKGLASDLARIGGRAVTDEGLNRSIGLYNENRRAIRELYALRCEHPHLAPAHEIYLILRASNAMDVEEHTEIVRGYLSAAPRGKNPRRDNVRVILTGAFCEQPPLTLIRAIEASGCDIVEDDWVLGTRMIAEGIPTDGDPFAALSNAYLSSAVRTASRYEPDGRKGAYLVERVRASRAEGVIFAAPSFCDPALLERPMLQAALAKEGIPHTAFKYAENTGQFQAIKEQTGTFADSIRLWGG